MTSLPLQMWILFQIFALCSLAIQGNYTFGENPNRLRSQIELVLRRPSLEITEQKLFCAGMLQPSEKFGEMLTAVLLSGIPLV